MIHYLSNEIPDGGLACALGCFDGVHAGHRLLLDAAKNDFLGNASAVWTFSEPLSRPFIENIDDRLRLIGEMGIAVAICEDFEEVKNMSPRSFVLHLHNDFGVRHFICGEDFRFGHDREGDAELLRKYAFELGDSITVVPPLTEYKLECAKEHIRPEEQGEDFSEKISSSLIRRLISEGEMELAEKYLSRRFGLTGEVAHGHRIGSEMGMPTINQRFEQGRVIPAFGVYYSLAVIDGVSYPSVTNIGIRPTVNSDENDVNCETHILDCDSDLYGKTVRVELCKRARPETKFDNLDDLKNAIAADIENARAYFGQK